MFGNGSNWNQRIYFIRFDNDFVVNHTQDELSVAVITKLSQQYKAKTFAWEIQSDPVSPGYVQPYLMGWIPEFSYLRSKNEINHAHYPGEWYDFDKFIKLEDLGTMYRKAYSWDEVRNMAILNLIESETIEELPLLKQLSKKILFSLYKKWFDTEPIFTDYSKLNFTSEFGKPTKSYSISDSTTVQPCGNYARWLANKILEK